MIVMQFYTYMTDTFDMGTDLMMLEVWAVKDDKWYSILYITPAEKFEQYYPIAQQMINSFQILV